MNDIVATDDQQLLARQLRRSRECIARSRTRSCPGHLSGKAVAPARYVCDVTICRSSNAEALAQGSHVNAQADIIDDECPPGALDELTFADDFRRMLEQHKQNVEGAAANPERLAVLLQNSLGGMEAKRTKRGNCPPQGGRTGPRAMLLIRGCGRAYIRGRIRSFRLSLPPTT